MIAKIKLYGFAAALSVVMIFCCSCSQLESKKYVLFEDDFSNGLDNWWIEGGGEVTGKNGRMYINANDPDNSGGGSDIVSTVWCKKKLDAENLHIKFDAYVLDSKKGVNNINFFFNYTHPDGDIYATRNRRESGDYGLYHDLNGYIITYLRDAMGESEPVDGVPQGRVRIRRCPGFNMIAQNYAYNAEAGRLREIEIIKKGKDIIYKVDGKELCRAVDQNDWKQGYFGFRTFMTSLWFDNIVVREIF